MIKISMSLDIPHVDTLIDDDGDDYMPSVNLECTIPDAANVSVALGVFVKTMYVNGYSLTSIERALKDMSETDDLMDYVNCFMY